MIKLNEEYKSESLKQFSTELEEKLCSMFRDIQGPFLKHCATSKSKILSTL